MTVADFRSDRMASPEGEGKARDALEKAWDAYHATNKAINKPLQAAFPGIKSLMRGWVGSTTVDLFGFWLTWRLVGGFEGMRQIGMSRSTIFRRISLFRAAFGVHPDVFEMPGVTVDVGEWLANFDEAFHTARASSDDGKPSQSQD